MKLADKVKVLNPNELVYIGSNSAFFFIGKPQEFLAEVENLNDEWTDKFLKSLKNAENALKLHITQKPKEDAEPVVNKVWVDGCSVMKTLEYGDQFEKWERKKAHLKSTIDSRMEILDNFTDFSTREVIRCYRNMDNTATIVIVDGDETARFWFYEEYLRYKNGEKITIDSELSDEDDDLEYDEDGEEIIE